MPKKLKFHGRETKVSLNGNKLKLIVSLFYLLLSVNEALRVIKYLHWVFVFRQSGYYFAPDTLCHWHKYTEAFRF